MNDSPATKAAVTPLQKRLQIGMLGKLFGDRDHAAFYVAGILSFLLFCLLVAVSYFPVVALPPGQVMTMLALTVGYMFGDRRR